MNSLRPLHQRRKIPVAHKKFHFSRRHTIWPMIEQSCLQWHTSVLQDTNRKNTDGRTGTNTDGNTSPLQIWNTSSNRPWHSPKDLDGMSPELLYRLVHGLLGAGKSQVLLWRKDYLETVWHYTMGDESVFVAGLSSMADSIGVATLHQFWSRI